MPELTTRPVEARQLKSNQLLRAILTERETELIQIWRLGTTPDVREHAWLALRELDILAGAIEDAIRKHSND